MPQSVEFHPDALAEAEASARWYAERSPAAGRAFAAELERAIHAIAEAPERWPAHRHGTRRYLLHRFPFHVIYRIELSRVIVAAVAHGSRRPGYWRRRS